MECTHWTTTNYLVASSRSGVASLLPSLHPGRKHLCKVVVVRHCKETSDLSAIGSVLDENGFTVPRTTEAGVLWRCFRSQKKIPIKQRPHLGGIETRSKTLFILVDQ
jgi:hypothetical protein